MGIEALSVFFFGRDVKSWPADQVSRRRLSSARLAPVV